MVNSLLLKQLFLHSIFLAEPSSGESQPKTRPIHCRVQQYFVYFGRQRIYHHNPMGKESTYLTKMISAPFGLYPLGLGIMVFTCGWHRSDIWFNCSHLLTGVVVRTPFIVRFDIKHHVVDPNSYKTYGSTNYLCVFYIPSDRTKQR